MHLTRRSLSVLGIWLVLWAGSATAQQALAQQAAQAQQAQASRPEFTRLLAHWTDYANPEYLKFVQESQPDVVQVGFYGGHFWSLAHTPFGKGYPAHFPVVGLKEQGDWFENLNKELHQQGVKVVGHFNVSFLVGDPDGPNGPTGFFHFYKNLWDESVLGPRPVEDPLELMERNADGTPRKTNSYSIGKMSEYSASLANPNWRKVLKAWVKAGIARGVDGFMINYFYRHNDLSPSSQKAFREYLTKRFTPEQLKSKFAIEDLATHKFEEIVGWHNPAETTPLRLEMLRFSQILTKDAFEEVFCQYGRSLKPDLILGQWNHLSYFSQISGDERCLLPKELWGKDEDYLWYSSGASACYTDLKEGWLGEVTLQARYVRGAFDDKPFAFGKYEQTRTRVYISELAANGGAPLGFYATFKNEDARKEIVRYFGFMKRYDNLYRANRPQSEVLLLYPRSKVHQGDVQPVDAFRKFGVELLNRHVLFDIMPDDLQTPENTRKYRHVLTYADADKLDYTTLEKYSRFQAPATVRVSVSRPAQAPEWTVHLVNYNREEPEKAKSPGRGIQDEKPLPVEQVEVNLMWPENLPVTAVLTCTPEDPESVPVDYRLEGGRLRFTVPRFLVYRIARVQYASDEGKTSKN